MIKNTAGVTLSQLPSGRRKLERDTYRFMTCKLQMEPRRIMRRCMKPYTLSQWATPGPGWRVLLTVTQAVIRLTSTWPLTSSLVREKVAPRQPEHRGWRVATMGQPSKTTPAQTPPSTCLEWDPQCFVCLEGSQKCHREEPMPSWRFQCLSRTVC